MKRSIRSSTIDDLPLLLPTDTAATETNPLNLSISAKNVNTLNLSTYKNGLYKTLEKLMAIINGGGDVILMLDYRMDRGIEKVKLILNIQFMIYIPTAQKGIEECV
jgi:hypothetical protein